MEKYLSPKEVARFPLGKKYKKTTYGGSKVFVKQKINLPSKKSISFELFLYNGKWSIAKEEKIKIIDPSIAKQLKELLSSLNKQKTKNPINQRLGIGEYKELYSNYADADSLGYYNKYSPEYIRVQDILLSIKNNSLVYDAGCNSGGIGKLLIQTNKCNVSGSEICPRLARIAKRKGLNTFCGLAEKTPFPNNYFDYSILSFILEHVIIPEDVIKESYRILKKGGKMIGHVPTEFGDWGKHTIGIHPEHLRAYTSAELKCLLEKFNLKNIIIKKERLVGRKIADYYFFHATK